MKIARFYYNRCTLVLCNLISSTLNGLVAIFHFIIKLSRLTTFNGFNIMQIKKGKVIQKQIENVNFAIKL